jgi:hypothetical protein
MGRASSTSELKSAAKTIVEQPLPKCTQSPTAHIVLPESRRRAFDRWARWLGLWLLDTLIATYGVVLALNLTADIWKPLMGDTIVIRIVLTPYYPFTLFFALLIGVWGYTHFRGSDRFWVWVLPAASLLHSLQDWRATNQDLLDSANAYKL